MLENQINIILKRIKNSTDSNYKIAKKTGITEATIGNYKNGKTKPTKANLKLLEKYFNENQMITEEHNNMATETLSINQNDSELERLKLMVETLINQIEEKDRLIKHLITHQEKLISKL